MAHVTLIRPPSLAARWVPAVIATPPLAHAYLAGTLTHHGHDVTIVDAVGEAPYRKTDLDDGVFCSFGLTIEEVAERIPAETSLIGVSSMFTQEWPNIRRLASAIKARHPAVPIVCGGEHVTAEPEYSLADCKEIDFIIAGEGEESLLELTECLAERRSLESVGGLIRRDGRRVVRNDPRPRIKQIDDIPEPRWDLTPIGSYLDDSLGFGVRMGRTIPLMATRGCPYRCTFCSSPQMWGTRWIARKPELVIAEMEKYIDEYDVNNFDFYDLTAIVRKDWIVKFCNLLLDKSSGITWQLPSGTRSEALDEEACDLLYRSGCRFLVYAPESGSPTVLERIKKRINLDKVKNSMRSALRMGMNVKYNIILGFPGETHREVWESMKFIARTARLGVNDCSIWLFSPYPGSELYEEQKQLGRTKFDDDYFVGLSAYSDFSKAASWNPQMSARTLKFYRLSGTALFYLVSYLGRPTRVYKLIRNLIRGTHESKLETVLAAMFARWAGRSTATPR